MGIPKYKLNENFFKNPEKWNQEHAYLLGWICSDGSNSDVRMSIRLQEKDKKILEILKEILEYEGPLIYLKRNKINIINGKYPFKSYQNRYSLNIGRMNFCKTLTNLGINGDKSHLEFPKYLKEELIPHFLRGYYEGDGTFCVYYPAGRLNFEINLIASKNFILTTQQILKKELGIETRIDYEGFYRNGVVVLRAAGVNNALKIFNYLYKDAHFCLKRKFRKFLRLVNHKKRNFKNGRNNKEDIECAIQTAKNIIQNCQY